MTVWTCFAVGLVLVIGTSISIIGALVVPRRVDSWITSAVDGLLDRTFLLTLRPVRSFELRDRVLGWQAPLALVVRLTVWMGLLVLGYALMMMPDTDGHLSDALRDAGSSMFTLGFAVPHGGDGQVLAYLAGFTGMVVVGLQIGYLPTLYSGFNKRETEVSLLVSRAGLPAWGPEILLRTHWGMGGGDTAPVLDELFVRWERWTAEVAESHATYPALLRLRSPRVDSHWLTSLIAVMDAAALHLALSPDAEPKINARLVLRMGFTTLDDMARTLKLAVPSQKSIDAEATPVSVTYDEFVAATAALRSVDYPVTMTDEEAWPHFRGWRVNYDTAALALCRELDAPPSMWTGPRRWPSEPRAPWRPAPGRGRVRD
ncbi:hypothetical protein [Nocardioides jejuensis]|uniref:Two pore domain potassium channel family protein n=1 Tax=Nocardioides jejuensis TaxID=2502782 RepID=A0A4R1C0V5_9ACTN|nr:hypothetical protein [Nocardioides jejuensis]TCJ24110.1 hypothetical protein EPD65_09360 [Nocardioides jejuensis]